MTKPLFVLASSSISRLNLLKQIGYQPDVIEAPDLDETPLKGELPKNLAFRLAGEKALKVQQKYPEAFILAADTVSSLGRRILPKTERREEALFCISKSSGRRQTIYTGVCGILGKRVITKLGKTVVKFKRLNHKEIEDFLDRPEEWSGKAGGYTLSGKAAAFLEFIRGDGESNVIGLPLLYTNNIIQSLYYDQSKHS